MYQMVTEFLGHGWLRSTEEGASNTEKCWGTNTLTVLTLMCTCLKIKDTVCFKVNILETNGW
jgi:hypothetical protein